MKNSFLLKNGFKAALLNSLFLSIFFLPSCTIFFMKITGNLKNPELEDSLSIINCGMKWKDPYDILWVPDSKTHFAQVVNKFESIPEVLIFDRNYNLLKNGNGNECRWMLISYFTDSLKHEYKMSMDSSYSFIESKCKVINQKKALTEYDYTIVYVWAKYCPKLSKSLFASLTEVKQKYKSRVRLISLNKDWQKDLHEQAPRLGKKNVEKNEHTKKNKSE